MFRSVTLLTAAILASNVSAEGWQGAGELGAVIANGNSNSEVINAALTVEKITTTWEHKAQLKWLTAEDDGEKSADALSAEWVSRYNLDERQFVFGSLRYFDDDFDSFTEIKTLGAGYGYRIFMGDITSWEVSAGLGYRDTEEELSGEDVSGLALLAFSSFEHKFNESTSVFDEFRLEYTSDNTFAENIAGIKVAMSDALALKVAYEVRHNTDVESDKANTDTLTSVGITYAF